MEEAKRISEVSELVQSLTNDIVVCEHAKNQFLTDTGVDAINEEVVALAEAHDLDSEMVNHWKNQFDSSTTTLPAPKVMSGDKARRLPILRGRYYEHDTKREFFIIAMCDILGVDRINVKYAGPEPKVLVEDIVWTKPKQLGIDPSVDPVIEDYAAAKVGEIYGINQARLKELRDESKSFRGFLMSVIAHDAKMTAERRASTDKNCKTSLWGAIARELEPDLNLNPNPNPNPKQKSEPMSSADASTPGKPNMERALQEYSAMIGNNLPWRPKKVTVTLVFEM